MPIAEAWQPVPELLAGPPSDSVTTSDLVEAAVSAAAPLPEPVRLVVERAEPVPDLTVLGAQALRWLAAHEPASLTGWLVGGSWAEACARLAAVVGAWTRYGPAGDGSLAVELRHAGMLDVVGRDQVGFVSRTTVHRRAED